VRARILVVVAAWLLGAATATGGCLLAVSLLGDGFGVTGGSNRQLTAAAVQKALADTKQEPSATPSVTLSRAAQARGAARHPRAARPAPSPSPSPTPSLTASSTPTQPATAAGTVFTSSAGTVTATCGSAGARLLIWSPAQGYEVDHVVRGPAAAASVVFGANTNMGTVTMNVSCPSGTPVSSTSSSPHDE
jgi:hypothetical protein